MVNLVLTISAILVSIFILIATVIIYWWVQKDILTGGRAINDYLTSKCLDDRPVFDAAEFPISAVLEANYQAILAEFEAYRKARPVPAFNNISKEASLDTVGWKSLFLRMFNQDTVLMGQFPITKSIIEQIPCATAYFSLLEPGTNIMAHRGIYKGVLRCHLGLIVPPTDCYLLVDGQRLEWQVGKTTWFDDIYEHEVHNNSAQERLVLFLDVERDFKSPWLNWINKMLLKMVTCNDVLLSAVRNANRKALEI